MFIHTEKEGFLRYVIKMILTKLIGFSLHKMNKSFSVYLSKSFQSKTKTIYTKVINSWYVISGRRGRDHSKYISYYGYFFFKSMDSWYIFMTRLSSLTQEQLIEGLCIQDFLLFRSINRIYYYYYYMYYLFYIVNYHEKQHTV